MNDVKQQIRTRKSVRTFDGRTVDEAARERLLSYAGSIWNPFDIPVEFRLLDAAAEGLNSPVVSGTSLFIGGKVKNVPYANAAFGYSFEELVLFAQSQSLGTVWIGGTMNRNAFEKAMELAADELMPCVSPVGYPAPQKSFRESVMRKAVKADERLPFEELFSDGILGVPLTREKAGRLGELLEMVRLAPSAVNKQPWRVVAAGNTAHFYLERSKGFNHGEGVDMQMVDVGIALCHFALTARENGFEARFVRQNPNPMLSLRAEYIASYVLS